MVRKVPSAKAEGTILKLDYFMDSSTATATETVIPTMGERWERGLWREERPERVAAVGVQRRRLVAKAHTGYRNRGSDAQHCDSNMQPAFAGCYLAMVGTKSDLCKSRGHDSI